MPKILEITLHNGFDTRTQKQIGLKTGEAADFKTFEQLLNAFKTQVEHFIRIKVTGNNTIEKIFMTHIPTPFLSLIIDDCVAQGMDYIQGGARYNSNYIQGVGMGTMTDALTALRKHVFEDKNISLPDFEKALEANFEGHDELLTSCFTKRPNTETTTNMPTSN
jgi:formate C-acetyltransferase